MKTKRVHHSANQHRDRGGKFSRKPGLIESPAQDTPPLPAINVREQDLVKMQEELKNMAEAVEKEKKKVEKEKKKVKKRKKKVEKREEAVEKREEEEKKVEEHLVECTKKLRRAARETLDI